MTFCGPARDTVLTNRQTEKLNFDTSYITMRSIIEVYKSDPIRSDFGTKIFISDWIGLIKLFRSRIGLRYSKCLVKYFHLNEKFILLKDFSDRIGILYQNLYRIRIRQFRIGSDFKH